MTYHTSWRESISACTKLHASKAARLKEVAEMGTEAMPHEAGYPGYRFVPPYKQLPGYQCESN